MKTLRHRLLTILSDIMAPLTVVVSFLMIIVVGAVLLWLPISNAEHARIPFLNAFFTSTSAVCVTGLTIYPTFSFWSLFGKTVLLVLIQIGGLGLLTIVSAAIAITGQKVTLKQSIVINSVFNLDGLRDLKRLVVNVMKITLLCEGLGAIVIGVRLAMLRDMTFLDAAYNGIFHSVSAFCNAGFDLLGCNSLDAFVGDFAINLSIIPLMLLGGIGFNCILDVLRVARPSFSPNKSITYRFRRLFLQSKLAITTTAVLLATGFAATFLGEYSNPKTIGGLSLGGKALAALFHTSALRTTGFHTIDVSALTSSGKLISILLMMIGGSPTSTAGGIKTVSFAIIVLSMVSVVRGRSQIVAFDRAVPLEALQKALTSTSLLLITSLVGIIAVSTTETRLGNEISFYSVALEVISAWTTVGYSAGITATLAPASKLVLIMCMLIGRIGAVTIMMPIASLLYGDTKSINYPDGKVIIG